MLNGYTMEELRTLVKALHHTLHDDGKADGAENGDPIFSHKQRLLAVELAELVQQEIAQRWRKGKRK